ncbi:hypothetical protein Z956_01310 [Clostridium botulinum D str. CCUG 7971]|uniref:NEAT domain-containing protein n=1 Tax=Clostridium botulinum TaxID=1491 RepID=UPI00052DDF96|nr:NEAT domain-containing protein [Clostridium botulinum]KGM97634.1 hypothetical protein Z956_01310 [Clostridium botulinum D str. CCUG 7971]OOV57398.1 hypothetical protein B0673_04480 [Clostridium botulinum D/C]OOV63070.1 hypothetical protein B1A69_00960 [Clostridium botulinum D/C]
MDIFQKINKGVGVAATAIIIAGGIPQVTQAMDNVNTVPKLEAKSICKNIENSIKNGTYEVDKLNVNLYSNMNAVPQKDSKVLDEKKSIEKSRKNKLEDNASKDQQKSLKSKKIKKENVQSQLKSEETKVKIKTLKAENDEPSMSGTYLEKEAKYIKENGKIYCEIKLLAVDWMKNIKIDVDGNEAKHTVKETGKTQVMGMEHKGGIIRFEVPRVNPKLTFHMYVVPMTSNVTFRVVGEEQNQDQTKPVEKPKENETKPDTKPTIKPTDSQVKPKEKPTGNEVKPNKPEEKPVKPVEVTTKPDNKPNSIIDIMKSGVYEIKSVFEVKNEEEKEIISKHLDKNINLEIENKKSYVVLKIKGKKDSIKQIIVDGNKAEVEVVEQNVIKKNRLSTKNTLSLMNAKSDEETTTIRFNIPKIDSNVQVELYDEESKKDIKFKLKLYMSNHGNIDENSKPQPKPQEKPQSNQTKPVENTKEQVKKQKTKQIKVKVLKEKSNESSMAGEYLDKNVIYTEKDSKRFFTLTVNRIDWMKNIAVSVNGRDVSYDKKESGQTAELTFEVGSENSEVILHMNVVPMGNARVAFRVIKDNSSSSTKPTTGKTEDRNEQNQKYKEKQKDKDKLKINANEDGMYRVNINALKKDSDEPSMAGQYLNGIADYEVKEGTKYLTVTLNRMDWMKNVAVYVNGDKKKYEEKSIGKNRSEIKFETDGIGAEVKLEMNVVPMGNSRVTFRVVPKKSSLELIKKYKDSSNKKEDVKDNKTTTNDKDNKNKDGLDNKHDSEKDNQKSSVSKPSASNEDNKTNNDLIKTSKEDNKNISSNKDGLYEINIKTLKENNNESSMAGTYLGNKARIQIKNGKKYTIVTLDRSDWMKNIDVLVNGKSVKYDVINVKSSANGEKTTTIKFEVPELNCEIKFKMNVEPMGNSRVTFRVVMQKDTLRFLQGNEYDPNKAEEYLNNLANETQGNKDYKSGLNTSNTSKNTNSPELSQKKLPKTGLPFGGGLIATIGSALSGLGFTLMKKNKKRGE